MKRMAIALLVAASSAACAGAARSAAASASRPASPTVEQLDALYSEAIRRSAVVSPADVLPLRPLTPGPDGNVTVTTWAFCLANAGPDRCDSYAPGRVTLKWDVWIVADEEFQNACSRLGGDINLRLSQLLGLPAPRRHLPPDTFERQFVTFSAVPIASVFRPCTDPRVDTDRCSIALPASLPPNAPPDFYRWFTNQAMSSWQLPAKGKDPDGYPWTRLGYTYNWAPEAASRYGVSEYVIPGDARPVEVTVTAVRTARDYCKTD